MNPNPNKDTQFINLGCKDYKEAWDYQTELFNHILQVKTENRTLPEDQQKPTPNYLIFCEHPHVYTLGKSGKENNLLPAESRGKFFSAFFRVLPRAIYLGKI